MDHADERTANDHEIPCEWHVRGETLDTMAAEPVHHEDVEETTRNAMPMVGVDVGESSSVRASVFICV